MKIIQTDLFTVIEADEGKILLAPDDYGAKKYYLGIHDTFENYIEIPEDQYVEPEEPKQD